MQTSSDAALLGISLERDAGEPLHAQLAQALRECILSGRVAPGARLPSSRQLADELQVSRVTVVTAMDQLMSEGYAEGRHGAGVFVAADLPEDVLQAPAEPPAVPAEALAGPEPMRPFQPAAPDLELFPHADWARLLDRVWRRPEPALLANADPLGWAPLRRAIASHLQQWRGITCAPDQVIVTSGTAESIDLLSRALLVRGGDVLIEEPGYRVLRRILELAGLEPVPVAVNEHGFDIARAGRRHRQAAAVVVTPSRQYPLGVTMPLARRLELIGWARRTGAIVIEDDYDSEYRYHGRPLPAMMSLEGAGDHVVYLGSFSKVMSSSLRLGYLVAPPTLRTAIAGILHMTGPRASLVAQPALARFMADGSFAAHIRRMRREYARRQTVLLDAIDRHLAGLLEADAAPAGMHLVARLSTALAARMDDAEASRRAAQAGVTAIPLSSYYAGPADRQGLILGYAGFADAALDDAAGRLARALA